MLTQEPQCRDFNLPYSASFASSLIVSPMQRADKRIIISFVLHPSLAAPILKADRNAGSIQLSYETRTLVVQQERTMREPFGSRNQEGKVEKRQRRPSRRRFPFIMNRNSLSAPPG